MILDSQELVVMPRESGKENFIYLEAHNPADRVVFGDSRSDSLLRRAGSRPGDGVGHMFSDYVYLDENEDSYIHYYFYGVPVKAPIPGALPSHRPDTVWAPAPARSLLGKVSALLKWDDNLLPVLIEPNQSGFLRMMDEGRYRLTLFEWRAPHPYSVAVGLDEDQRTHHSIIVPRPSRQRSARHRPAFVQGTGVTSYSSTMNRNWGEIGWNEPQHLPDTIE